MHKKLLLTASVLAMTCGSAMAADLGRGGLKDGPVSYDTSGSPAIWTGWTFGGNVGWASREISGRRSITASKNAVYDEVPNGSTCRGSDANGFNHYYSYDNVVKPEGEQEKDAEPLSTIDLFCKVYQAEFVHDDNFDSDGLQGGIEVGRRIQSGGWVFQAAIGVNIDADSKVSREYDTKLVETLDDYRLPYADPQTGHAFASVEKQGDVQAVLRVGRLLDSEQRLLVGIGGGLAAGRFKVSGHHEFDGGSTSSVGDSIIDDSGLLTTNYSDTKTAIGYVLEAFATYKITPNLDLGILAQYKDFGSFSVADSVSTGAYDFAIGTWEKSAHDRMEVDANETTIKATLTYTFNE